MDYQTLYLVLFTALLIQTAALLLSWRQNPEEVGLRDWGLSATLMTSGSLLVLLGLFFAGGRMAAEAPLPTRLLLDMGSSTAATGWLLAWQGIRRFHHRPVGGRWTLPLFWLLFTLVMMPGSGLPGWRVTGVGLTIGVFGCLILWELNRDRAGRNLVVHMATLAMAVVVVCWVARGLWALSDLAQASGTRWVDVACIYSSIVMSMTFTLSLILLTNQRVHARLREQASRDPLTGALNRRAFMEASRPLFGALRREPASLAVCLLDIDHFKRINDTQGHAAGDEVLRAFSDLAQGQLREGDLFARFGGEEFVILFQLGDTPHPGIATQAIERLRRAWARHPAGDIMDLDPVTFSAGISHATGPSQADLDTLLRVADDALYQAKAAGRDRAVVSPAALPDGAPHPPLERPLPSRP